MTTTTATRAAALMVAAGVVLSGAAMSTASIANADPRYSTTCTQQHLDAGYTAAEARAECKGDEKPRGVIKPKIAPKPTKPATNPVGTPRNWWDHLPSFLYPLLIFGAMTAAVFIGIYGYGRAKQAQFRRQQTQQFAAEEMEAPYADYPEDVPPEPEYMMSDVPPAYAQQAPRADYTEPPTDSAAPPTPPTDSEPHQQQESKTGFEGLV